MQPTAMLSILALSTLASALPSHSGLYRRSGCNYRPDMMNGNSYTTTPLFLLRIEEAATNKTIGYVDAFSTDYAVVSDRNASAPGFVAPYYNGYGSLIFWAGDNGTDRAFTADETKLSNSSSTLPVTTLISTQADGQPSCGTAPVYMQSKYSGTGSCVFGGEDVDIHFRCPFPGTTNDTPEPCWAQSYYACMNTGLSGVSNDQRVLFFGNATTAVARPDCCMVDLMAVTSKHTRNTARAWPDQAEKENRPPTSNKRTISLAGIFDEIRNKRLKGEDESEVNLQRSPAARRGIAQAEGFRPQSKVTPRNEGHRAAREAGSAAGEFFAQFTVKKKQALHPIYRDFDETVSAYEQGVSKSTEALLQPVWAELEARVEGLDVHGRPIHRPGVPSDGDLERLEADIRALSKPLQEEEMDVEIPQPDGTKIIKRITLGTVFLGYTKLCARKNTELQSHEQELARLDQDIAAAYDKLSDESDLARAKERLDADMAKFKQASKTAKDRLAAEFEHARAEDKAASAETNKKIQEFMKALQ
ncbi:hypothetical protein B0A55_03182 [Friedmanniomyces simplex]|uniref:Uncharacterized protein n=1 Tax=Friedmanniomyces simplex TaxID=329884 RepID=A0A4U0XHF5_9PEZI|nr:hypothetical protein B0A55_03182 [Friedmanniomyces simplex]